MTYATITSPHASPDDRIVVAVVGDSISAGTPNWDPLPAARAAIAAPDEQSTWVYWAAAADPRLEFRVTAVDGETTDQIAGRMGLVVDGCAALVVQGGINDLVGGRSPQEAADGVRAMVGDGRGRDLPVAVPEILP